MHDIKIIYDNKEELKAVENVLELFSNKIISMIKSYQYEIKYVLSVKEDESVKGECNAFYTIIDTCYDENENSENSSQKYTINDLWFKIEIRKFLNEKEHTIAHEFGHSIDYILGKLTGRIRLSTSEKFIEFYKAYRDDYPCGSYNKSNNKEFFANLIQDYLYNKENIPEELLFYLKEHLE